MHLTLHSIGKSFSFCLLLTLGLLLADSSVTRAQNPQPSTSPTPVPMKVIGVETYRTSYSYKEKKAADREAGIGDLIVVKVENLSAAMKKDNLDPRDLILYLNGLEMKGLNGELYGVADSNELLYELKRTDESRAAWNTLLGSPTSEYLRGVSVSVGLADKQALPHDPKEANIQLRVYHPVWAVICLIGLVFMIILFVKLARTTDIIRDSGPPNPPEGKKKPYSLARSQAAFWFFLVIGSFLLIYLITGDYNTITEQALILIGIGTGTALGAAMIDASKRDTADTSLQTLGPQASKLAAEVSELTAQISGLEAKVNATPPTATDADRQTLSAAKIELALKQSQLAETQKQINDVKSGLSKPVSESFGKDILTDAGGVNFHRFQMVAWTIILGFLFLIAVYNTLGMPTFNGTLLALMGISSGTYLGFKIPEQQSSPNSSTNAAPPPPGSTPATPNTGSTGAASTTGTSGSSSGTVG